MIPANMIEGFQMRQICLREEGTPCQIRRKDR